MKSKSIPFWLFFLLLIIFNGCSEKYRIGYPIENSNKRLSIRVENRSMAGQIGPTLNRTVKDELAKMGILQVANHPNDAKFLVLIILEDYSQHAQAYNPDDTLLASGFELRIRSRFQVSNRNNGQSISSFTLSTRGFAMRSRSLEKPRDRQALMDMSRELGSRIARKLVYQSF